MRLVADEKKSRDRWSLVSALETGLFNYTSSAEKRNAENALVITGETATAQQYQTEFNRLWNESSLVTCSKTETN